MASVDNNLLLDKKVPEFPVRMSSSPDKIAKQLVEILKEMRQLVSGMNEGDLVDVVLGLDELHNRACVLDPTGEHSDEFTDEFAILWYKITCC